MNTPTKTEIENRIQLAAFAANHFAHWQRLGVEATRSHVAHADDNLPRHHRSSNEQSELSAADKFLLLSQQL